MKRTLTHIFLFPLPVVIWVSCGQVNRLTRVKKVPKKYSPNYSCGEIKAPKTNINNMPWIICSDCAENMTCNNAGGKVKAKDISYLDPFLGIRKKKDYIIFIKYKPDIPKNDKLDYKMAEYYGWIHKSKVLINFRSLTYVSAFMKDKMVAGISSTTMFSHSGKYIAFDSIKLCKDMKTGELAVKIGVYNLIYMLKQSEDKTRTAVAQTTELNPENVKENVLGRIDNSLLQDAEKVLYVYKTSIPASKLQLKLRKDTIMLVYEEINDLQSVLSERYKVIIYSPFFFECEKDKQCAIKTVLNIPLLDYNLDYIFNVNGGHISYRKFRAILSKKLKHINVVIVIDDKRHTINHFLKIVDALQNLQPVFEGKDDKFQYRLGCVLDFVTNARLFNPLFREFDLDNSTLINFLTDKANKKKELRPGNIVSAWGKINKVFELVKDNAEATNLIIVVDETGYSSEKITRDMVNELAGNNCRVAGFLIYVGEDDSYNNFVLNNESMVTSYSYTLHHTKGNLLVSLKQLLHENYFARLGDMRDGYRLDLTENSITQGAIFFPEKGVTLFLNVLINNLDTIIHQIKEDNNSLIHYRASAFAATDNNCTRFDSLFVVWYDLLQKRMPRRILVSGFKNDLPRWPYASQLLLCNDSVRKDIRYKLLLNGNEMKDVNEFVEALSKYEVDFIKPGEEKKKPYKCPDDYIFEEMERMGTVNYTPYSNGSVSVQYY